MIKNFAIFIDGDNISSRHFDAIIAAVRRHGEIFETRIFGLETRLNGWIKTSAKNFALLALVSGAADKATDFYLDRETNKMVLSNIAVNAYCIVSSDSHFINTAEHLKAQGKYVLGIGESKSKNEWCESCDIFMKLENYPAPEITVLPDIINNTNYSEVIPDEIIEYGFSQCETDPQGWVNLAYFCYTAKGKYRDLSWYLYGKNASDALANYAIKTDKIEVERKHPTSRLRRKCI